MIRIWLECIRICMNILDLYRFVWDIRSLTWDHSGGVNASHIPLPGRLELTSRKNSKKRWRNSKQRCHTEDVWRATHLGWFHGFVRCPCSGVRFFWATTFEAALIYWITAIFEWGTPWEHQACHRCFNGCFLAVLVSFCFWNLFPKTLTLSLSEIQ